MFFGSLKRRGTVELMEGDFGTQAFRLFADVVTYLSRLDKSFGQDIDAAEIIAIVAFFGWNCLEGNSKKARLTDSSALVADTLCIAISGAYGRQRRLTEELIKSETDQARKSAAAYIDLYSRCLRTKDLRPFMCECFEKLTGAEPELAVGAFMTHSLNFFDLKLTAEDKLAATL